MDNLPKRKPTRWSLFDYSSQGLYFLTICTKDRRNLLSHISVGDGASTSRENNMPTVQLTEMGKIVEKYIMSTERIKNVFVDKYVIMPNHIHMIVFIKNSTEARGTSRAPSPTDNCVALEGTSRAPSPTDNCVALEGTSRAPSPTNKILPQAVSALKRLCNKEIGENIFQRSYYDHVIRDEKDYQTRVIYIYENPMRWYYDELYNE